MLPILLRPGMLPIPFKIPPVKPVVALIAFKSSNCLFRAWLVFSTSPVLALKAPSKLSKAAPSSSVRPTLVFLAHNSSSCC